MNNTRLISKYGEPIQIGLASTKAYFEDSRKTYYLKSNVSYTSFDIEVIHTIEDILLDDVLVLGGENFGVLEANPIKTSGAISYCETVAYKDDFINDVSIQKQSNATAGCNLPNATADAPIVTKARIKTIKPTDYLNYALQGAKVPTHIFVIKYLVGVTTGDEISFGERNFEVLAIENINENNTLLMFDCIEVL